MKSLGDNRASLLSTLLYLVSRRRQRPAVGNADDAVVARNVLTPDYNIDLTISI